MGLAVRLWLLTRHHREDEGDANDNIVRIYQNVGNHPHIDVPGPPRGEHDR